MSVRKFWILTLLACAFSLKAAPSVGLLQMFDGTSLHGNLEDISPNVGVAWGIAASTKAMVLKPDNISGIRFDGAQATNRVAQPTCRFRFHNGDEVLGNLIGIDGESATIESWFGGKLTSPKKAFASLQFSTRGFKVLYEGPNGPDEWKSGPRGNGWTYKDGALLANGAEILGRDFGLTNSSSLEFDLAWSGRFSLTVTVYAQAIERYDYSTSAYVFYFSPDGVSVQRIQAGAGAMMLGRADIPAMMSRNHVRLEIRSNKEEGTLSLFANGSLVQRWKDTRGFVSNGTGIVFYSQVEAPTLKLSNIKVSEWDGRFEPDTSTNEPPKEDLVYLANKDKVTGKVEGLMDGKLKMETHSTVLQIPLNRVTEIYFAKADDVEEKPSPWAVRASFPGGEGVAFQLERWNSTEVIGRSANFGPVAFSPKAIRFLQFNLERSNPQALDAETEDDWIPELNE